MEIELKFQIPAEAATAVRQAVATATARTTRLRAVYADTPDRRLAGAGMALRLRQEGSLWVQTVKGRGDGQLRRLEHEVVLGRQGTPPTLDIARHDDDPTGRALRMALGDQAGRLSPLFSTDVRRTHRVLSRLGARVELALDQGRILCGDSQAPIRELEFELKGGTIGGLIAIARGWVQRHGLWLDVRSKAERGEWMLAGRHCGAPASSQPAGLTEAMAPIDALRAGVAACLAQILPNAAALASDHGGPEHLHQLRVGLRRLRSALRLFGHWSDGDTGPWDAALGELCSALGAARDGDALRDWLLPALAALEAPPLRWPDRFAADGPSPGERLRSPEVNGLWLDLLAFVHGAPVADVAQTGGPDAANKADKADKAEPLSRLARAPLERLRRSLRRDADRFMTLSDHDRHRLRKRLKRLRYGMDMAAGLLPHSATRRELKALQACQEALGEFNDLCVAEDWLARQTDAQPAAAWFALGWLAGRRRGLLRQADQALRRWR